MTCTTPRRTAYRPRATPTGRPRIRFATASAKSPAPSAGVKHWAPSATFKHPAPSSGKRIWSPSANLKHPSPTAGARQI